MTDSGEAEFRERRASAFALRGYGTLAFAGVIGVLGLGACVWLGFYLGVHNTLKGLSQEQRAATYVGANPKPKAPIAITVVPIDCSTVTRAEFDPGWLTGTLVMYARNDCHKRENYLAWHWSLLSPDQTAIKSGYDNTAHCPAPIEPGDRAECRLEVDLDDRASGIRVWTTTTATP